MLTDREQEVLELVCQGLTNHQIAERLVLSKNTISTHIANLFEKTNQNWRVGLIIWAFTQGICRAPEIIAQNDI